MPHAVAISGMGIVSCHGVELDAHREALSLGHCKLREVDRSAGYHRRTGSRFAALVEPDCYRTILPPLKARRMSPPSRYAVVAARLALEDAGLAGDALSSDHGEEATAVVLGTSYGPSSYTERILRQILLESPLAASPMLFTESVANAPAAQVALGLDCKGPNITVTQREASALLAVAEGISLVRSGRVRRALVGGVEEVNPLLHAVLDRFAALAGSHGNGGKGDEEGKSAGNRVMDEQARALDRFRHGFNVGEGAAILVLERADDLERRGGRARAWVGPYARAFDARAPVTGWSETAPGAAHRLGSIFQSHGWTEGLSGIVSGANGSQTGDRLEAWLSRRAALSGGTERVVTPKNFLGEQGVAVLVGALLHFEGIPSAVPKGFVKDNALGITPHQGSLPPGKYLLSAAAAGGSCCWLGLESG